MIKFEHTDQIWEEQITQCNFSCPQTFQPFQQRFENINASTLHQFIYLYTYKPDEYISINRTRRETRKNVYYFFRSFKLYNMCPVVVHGTKQVYGTKVEPVL